MKIGGMGSIEQWDQTRGEALARGVLDAHEEATAEGTRDGPAIESGKPIEGAASNDRGEMIGRLQGVVRGILDGDIDDGQQVLTAAAEVVVDTEVEKFELFIDDSEKARLLDQLLGDPVVLSELGELMKGIAREMAMK